MNDVVQNNDEVVESRMNFNTVAAVLFIALAVVLFLIIPHQIDEPLIVVTGSKTNLPAELFPQLVAGAFLVLGAWFAWVSLSIAQRNGFLDLDREAIINVFVTLVMMAIYVPLMVNIGFVAGSAIMVFAMSTYFGNRNYVLGVLISILFPMLVFLTFRRLLLVELPPFPVDIPILTNWSLI